MPYITLKAFSFLQPRLRSLGVPSSSWDMDIHPGETVADILHKLGLEQAEVEAVFVNGRTAPLSTPLQNGDRLALIPPGTPGPYRVLLGIRNANK